MEIYHPGKYTKLFRMQKIKFKWKLLKRCYLNYIELNEIV